MIVVTAIIALFRGVSILAIDWFDARREVGLVGVL